MSLPLDGEHYLSGGEVRRYNLRPCGRRHSLRLICKKCKDARILAQVRRSQNPITPDLRDWVLKRDDYTCQHCSTNEDLTVDHIKAVIMGGKTDPDNLQTLCRPCNSRKGSQ